MSREIAEPVDEFGQQVSEPPRTCGVSEGAGLFVLMR